jgi:hypothetical protein
MSSHTSNLSPTKTENMPDPVTIEDVGTGFEDLIEDCYDDSEDW